MSRGYKIELSLFIHDLLHIYWFAPPLALGGRWVGVSGGMGIPLDAYTGAHTHKHAKIYMYRNCKWPATLFIMINISVCVCTCMCMHVCAHVHMCGGCPHHPSPQNPKSVKIQEVLNELRYFNSVWRFEICRDSSTYGWMYGLVSGWVDRWVDWSGYVKSLKIK